MISMIVGVKRIINHHADLSFAIAIGGDGDGKDDDDKTVVDLQFSYLVHFRVVRSVSSMLMLMLMLLLVLMLMLMVMIINYRYFNLTFPESSARSCEVRHP